jgi:hypothetical protein
MDRFDAMRVFTRIVERRSFSKAAEDLGLPRSSLTDAVRGLEMRLGGTTAAAHDAPGSPTLDGEAYYQRCVSLIADMEEAEGAFVGAKPSGFIRVDVHGTQARYFLLGPERTKRPPGTHSQTYRECKGIKIGIPVKIYRSILIPIREDPAVERPLADCFGVQYSG